MHKNEKRKFISVAAFTLLIAATITVDIVYIFNIVKWSKHPDYGFSFHTATGTKTVSEVRENAIKAGMKVGDQILKANDKSFTTLQDLRKLLQRDIGGKNTYLIERNGRAIELTITTKLSGYKTPFVKSGLPFIVGLSYSLIGTLVFLMKPHQRTSWIFFVFGIAFGLFLTFLFSSGKMNPVWLNDLNIFAYTLIPAVFIHLALCFPEEHNLLKKYSYVQITPYLVSVFLFLQINSLAPTTIDIPKTWLIFLLSYITVGVMVFIISSLYIRLTSLSEIIKRRSGMILLGFAISASVPLLDFGMGILFKVNILPAITYDLLFFIFFPIFIGYSIVKHDLFDFDTIIKRTYGYILTTVSIAGSYGLFVLVSNLVFAKFEITQSPMFPLVFILAVIFLFNPIRNRAQKFIDRVFYRLEYDFQETVHKISETMRSLLKLDEIGKNIMNISLGTLFVDGGGVMLLNPERKVYECLTAAGKREVKHNGDYIKDPLRSGMRIGVKNKVPLETGESEVEDRDIQDSLLSKVQLSINEPFIQKIAERKKEVTVYDIQEDPFFQDQRLSCMDAFDKLQATLIVPLIYEDRLTGLISLGQKKSGKFYRKEDINLLNTLANQGAVAIENALMIEEVIEKERMEEELSIARDLQTSMLPAECPTIEGFEISAYSVSAREVGGDFYDFIKMGEDKVGMVIGDVTGKSVSGALVMSASRSVFRMLSEENLGVGEIMMRANRRTKKDIKSGMFVALLYAVLDAKDNTLSLCSAGQTQPIHWSAERGESELVETRGDTFPLGILEDVDYEETNIYLKAGDKVVFYTDGIVEAMNDKEEIFGFDRLVEVIQGADSITADALLKKILYKVNEFVGKAVQHDDLTIIVLGVDD